MKHVTTHPLILSGLLLWGCSSPAPVATPLADSAVISSSSSQSTGALLVKPAPSAKVVFEPTSPRTVNARFVITMPRAQSGFSTQALALNNINFVKLSITGIGMDTPLYADGADSEGLIANAGGTFSLSVSNVPFGRARVATLSCYDAEGQPIPGAIVKGSFHVDSETVPTELSFRSTPVAEVLEALMGSTPGDHLASLLDLAQLAAFVDGLTGLVGTAPNYIYTTHPVLISAAALAAELQANGGNVAALNPASPSYAITPGQIAVSLAGLIGPDTATLNVRDPASPLLSGQSNGARQVLNVAPGTWQLEGTAAGYSADRSPLVTVSAGQSSDAGVLTFTPAHAPAIANLSATAGPVGSSLQINGSHFHHSIAGNTVSFNGVVATITAASTSQLTVSVPAGIAGTQQISVNVGGQSSNSESFAVVPVLSSLSTSAGPVGSSLQINGSGFSSNPAANNVNLSGVEAIVTEASSTQLTINVPQAASGNLAVSVAGQSSAPKAFAVTPTVSLSAPTANSTVSGALSLQASVSAGNPVSEVAFYAGNTLLGVDTSAPYAFDWDSRSAGSGTVSLSARVTDSLNQEASSPSVPVTVNLPPVIAGITASVNPLPGLSYPVLLQCQASDAEDTLPEAAYQWQTDGGSFGQFSSSTGSQVFWTAPATAGGPYTVRCTVSDPHGSSSQTLSLSVSSGSGTLNGSGGLF